MDKPFSVEQIKTALLAVRDGATEPQLRMLKAHYKARTISMDKLAAAGGYGERYRAANSQYGTLCGRIASQLGFVPDGDKIFKIAEASPREGKEPAKWRMDDVVATALEELGWEIGPLPKD